MRVRRFGELLIKRSLLPAPVNYRSLNVRLASFCRDTRNPLTEADSAAGSRIGMISLRPVFAGKRALGHVFSGLKPFATPAAGGAGAATEPCPRRPIDPSKFLIADNSALAVAARGDPPASRIASCFSPCG